MTEPPFEDLYAAAGDDLGALPWAALRPRPELLAWLDRLPPADGRPALVIGCGLGDDAEALAGRGYAVTAFDVAPSAVAQCHRRFPDSVVDYQIADLLDLPPGWHGAFAVVVEINDIQSLPDDVRAAAVAAVAAPVAVGGHLFVRGLLRPDDEPLTTRPWPLTRADLGGFVTAGLREVELELTALPGRAEQVFVGSYTRD